MADPNKAFSERNSPAEGVGPYEFNIPALAPGETHTINLRERENGRFVVLSPAGYDTVNITNSTDNVTLRITINETNSYEVPPNTQPSIGIPGQYRYDITNTEPSGGATAAAEDTNLTVLKEAYGADEQARSSRQESAVRKVIRHFTGV
jgi:hypothetical protein